MRTHERLAHSFVRIILYFWLLAAVWTAFISQAHGQTYQTYQNPRFQLGTSYSGYKLCTYAAGTSTPQATYKDNSGTLNTNPILLDSNGAAVVYLNAALNYKYTLLSAGTDTTCSTGSLQWTQDNISGLLSGGSLTLSGNLLFSADNTYDIGASGANRPRNLYLAGNATFGGALSVAGNFACKYIETSRCVDAANSAGWAGTDFPAWINSAYADCPTPSSGQTLCKIDAFPKTDGTCYTATTLINLATSGKPMDVDFHGACLNYGAVTSGTYFTIDVGQGPAIGWRLSNLKILGACITTACTGVTAIGLNLGPTNGAVGGLIDNLQMSVAGGANGFAVGIQVNSGAFMTQCRNCYIYRSAIGVSETNGAEGWKMIGGAVAQNATGLQTTGSGSKSEYIAVQFDDNTTTSYSRQNATTFDIDFVDCHWENAGLGGLNVITDAGSTGTVKYFGGDVQEDRTTSSGTALFTFGGSVIEVEGLSVFSSGFSYTEIANLTNGSSTAYLRFLVKSLTLFTNSYNQAFAGRIYDTSVSTTAAQSPATFNFFNFRTNGLFCWDVAGSAADIGFSRINSSTLGLGANCTQNSTTGNLTLAQINAANVNATGMVFLSGVPTPTAGNAVMGYASNVAVVSNNGDTASPIARLGAAQSFSAAQNFSSNKVALTADWTCGTAGTVSSCVAATIVGSGGGVPLTFTLPLVAASYKLECDLVVGQATAATANNWNLLTATNGATNITAFYDMYTAATAKAAGATTDQASTTTTFSIGGAWTLGGTATKMPVHIYAGIEGASASGTVISLQLVAPTVADLVTIYRGSSCSIY